MKSIILIISVLFLLFSCNGPSPDMDYRQEMRDFVQGISAYAKNLKTGFIIIPQNGHELYTKESEPDGDADHTYLGAIDGVGREDLFYGYDSDDAATPSSARDEMISFLNVAENNGVEALVTDYCSTHSKMDDSYQQNNLRGYISFAADHRELDNIPAYPAVPYHQNTDNITSLGAAQNFLYLLNPSSYASKDAFLAELRATEYDLFIIDLFFSETVGLTADEIDSLKSKPTGGGSRLVIAYMSIGEAEDYRYYWDPEWDTNPPDWIEEENPGWPGNYIVRYWDPEWQDIIYGNDDSYTKKIIDAHFDGVYLDIIDAYEYFE
jgi:cysteinyl-tRNA synthetase